MPRVTADAIEQSAHLLEPDDHPQAEALHREALTLRAKHGLWLMCLDSLENLARLAARAGSFTTAARLLGTCDRAREEMGCPRRTPVTDVRTRVTDAMGCESSTEALAEGRRMNIEEAIAYAQRARGPRGRPATGWASLTPTEKNVLRLAKDGLTNPQISHRLFMSRSTVKTHLSHVYAKLDVANRTELAARAASEESRP